MEKQNKLNKTGLDVDLDQWSNLRTRLLLQLSTKTKQTIPEYAKTLQQSGPKRNGMIINVTKRQEALPTNIKCEKSVAAPMCLERFYHVQSTQTFRSARFHKKRK